MSNNENFNFERTIQIGTAILLSVSVVIYCFSLGYFYQLEIPGYPSLLSSSKFYLNSVLKNLYNNPVYIFGVIIIFACLFVTIFLIEKPKEKWGCNHVISIVLSLLTSLFTLLFNVKFFSLVLPVVLTFFMGCVLFSILHKKEITANKKPHFILGYFLIVLIFSFWSFSTIRLNHFKEDQNEYFPNAVSVGRHTPSNVIWFDSNVRFLYFCDLTKGFLYGTNDSGETFIETEMSCTMFDVVCSDSQ